MTEQLAGLVMSVDADAAGLAALVEPLRGLELAVAELPDERPLVAVRGALTAVHDLKDVSPAEGLKAVSEAVAKVQGFLAEATARKVPRRRVDRDPETMELVRDFLQESGDGLGTADEILLNVESAGATPDKVNALFRVFHTIKGVAGFLELSEVVGLAHCTESLMNEVRDGHAPLTGETLDLVFKATALMRNLLDSLKQAVEAGVELVPNPDTPPLVERLKARIARIEAETASPEAAAPAPAPVASAPVLAAVPSAPVPAAVPSAPVLAAVPSAPMLAAPPPVPSAPVPSAPLPSAPLAAAPAPMASAPRPSAPPPYASAPTPSAPGGFSPLASAPPPNPSAPEGGGPTVSKLKETVKVDLERVDGMVEMIGELIIVESMLKHAPEINGAASLRLRNSLSQLGKISRDLQSAAMRMRTVPVHTTFQKMARLTREVGRKAGKEVVLTTSGDGTEMDRAMVERLEDPLVHMVRNAVDHGIERPEVRVAAGKPACGTLTLSASHKGGSILVELTDDGKGLQREAILRKAVQKGIVSNPAGLTDAEVFALIFAPGFSTAEKVTEVSGRGVGMDVVKRNVEGMRGQVVIESVPGKGSTFRLVLPLTLAIIDGMLVKVGPERYLIPSLSIVEALQPTPAMLSSMAERDELLTVRGQVMPLLRLSTMLSVDQARVDPTTALVVVVESGGKRVGLLVDQVLAQQQVVIKSLGQGVGKAEYYSGAAILSDGCVGLILNIDKLCSLITYKHRVTRGDVSAEART
jgi:two-component system chemotaxis sensor kinase CheA